MLFSLIYIYEFNSIFIYFFVKFLFINKLWIDRNIWQQLQVARLFKYASPYCFLLLKACNNHLVALFSVSSSSNSGTPFREAQKVKVYENYSIQELESGDETDDDEQPNKPIPQWAKNPALMNKVQFQGVSMINFTKLFRASANSNIVLEDIFKIKRKNFNERSSSAFWSSPPVWNTNGLKGDESFRRMPRCWKSRAYFVTFYLHKSLTSYRF